MCREADARRGETLHLRDVMRCAEVMLQTAVWSRLFPRILPAPALIVANYHVSVKDADTLDLPSEDVTVCVRFSSQ